VKPKKIYWDCAVCDTQNISAYKNSFKAPNQYRQKEVCKGCGKTNLLSLSLNVNEMTNDNMVVYRKRD